MVKKRFDVNLFETLMVKQWCVHGLFYGPCSRQRPQWPEAVLKRQQLCVCGVVRSSSADWRDVTPEQDALLYNNTPFKRISAEK